MNNLRAKGLFTHGQAPLTSRGSRPVASLGPPASPPKPKLLDQVRLAIRFNRGGRGVRSRADML